MESFIINENRDFALNISTFLENLEEVLKEEVPKELHLYDVSSLQAIDSLSMFLAEYIKIAINNSLIEE